MTNKIFKKIQLCCLNGAKDDIDYVMSLLNMDANIPTLKVIDYYLSTVKTHDGLCQIEYYLFNGTQMQRNYCTLFYIRRDEWDKVDKAFKLGLIDEIQAYAR